MNITMPTSNELAAHRSGVKLGFAAGIAFCAGISYARRLKRENESMKRHARNPI